MRPGRGPCCILEKGAPTVAKIVHEPQFSEFATTSPIHGRIILYLGYEGRQKN